jgi:hypothetical protein
MNFDSKEYDRARELARRQDLTNPSTCLEWVMSWELAFTRYPPWLEGGMRFNGRTLEVV